MQATDRLDTRILNKRHPPGVEWVFEQVIQRLTRERLTLWCTEAFFGKDRQYLGLLLAKACRSQFEGAPNKGRILVRLDVRSTLGADVDVANCRTPWNAPGGDGLAIPVPLLLRVGVRETLIV